MTQRLYDLLEIVTEDKPEVRCCDKFSIAERQLRIADVEAANLIRAMNNFSLTLEPRLSDGIEIPQPSQKPEEQ